MNRIENFVSEIASDLRICGYAYFPAYLNHDELRKRLMAEFKTLIFIEIDKDRKYFIISDEGKKIVLKFISSKIYNFKRVIHQAELKPNDKIKFQTEIERLHKLQSLLESVDF